MYVYARECVYMSMCVGATAYVCRSEDKLQELVLFLYHVSPRDGSSGCQAWWQAPPSFPESEVVVAQYMACLCHWRQTCLVNRCPLCIPQNRNLITVKPSPQSVFVEREPGEYMAEVGLWRYSNQKEGFKDMLLDVGEVHN